MTERPILFSAPMVRAILAGTKTQTRRVVKPRGKFPRIDGEMHPDGSGETWTDWGPCPYGVPGDTLWVRETWGMSYVDIASGRPYTRGGEWGSPSRPGRAQCAVYRADGETMPDDHGHEVARWTPSIHMPRWASRITLRVTSVRVERVQDISEEDARAEGVRADDISHVGVPCYSARQNFERLWRSINGAESWESNPFVWCVGFERAEAAHG